MAEVKEKRRGRPPGSKNKVKRSTIESIERKTISHTNGTRKRAPRSSFLQVSPKHLKLIQKWSNDTKIGMQQVLDDFMNAGAVAAPKIYKGLINSRKAIEDLFDAETNTEVVVPQKGTGERNGFSDPEDHKPDVRSGMDERSRIQELPGLTPVGPGHSETASADLGELTGVIDAPPTTTPEEEQLEEEEEDTEPPY